MRVSDDQVSWSVSCILALSYIGRKREEMGRSIKEDVMLCNAPHTSILSVNGLPSKVLNIDLGKKTADNLREVIHYALCKVNSDPAYIKYC